MTDLSSETEMPLLDRVVLNFLSPCNMACKYCYIPFDRSTYDETTLFAVLRRCSELGARIITIGGGDPLQVPFLVSLLEKAKTLFGHVHLDTNLLELANHDLKRLTACIDLLGVPLDGSSRLTHATMRSHHLHFDILLENLAIVSSRIKSIKINTVVAKYNLADIPAIYQTITPFNIRIWSLYQFWPLARGKRHVSFFGLSSGEFAQCRKRVAELRPTMRVEWNSIESRVGSYFFVSQDARVYVTDPTDPTRYLFLGSIFDDKTIDSWSRLAFSSVREAALERY